MELLKNFPKLLPRGVLRTLFIFWLAVFFSYLAYHVWGASLVDDMYYERSVSFLNEMLQSRDRFPLEWYYARADYLVHTVILWLCAGSIFLVLVVSLPALLKPFLATFVFLLLIAALAHLSGNHIWYYVGDRAEITSLSPLVGIVTNIGILLWCASASVCFFCSAKLLSERKFLFVSGLLTSMLLLDDLFMLHEYFLLYYFGVPQKATFIVYGMATLVYLVVFIKSIVRTEFGILLVAFVFFGLSMGIDLWVKVKGMANIFEDAFKLFGIVAWSTYFLRLCSQYIDASRVLGSWPWAHAGVGAPEGQSEPAATDTRLDSPSSQDGNGTSGSGLA